MSKREYFSISGLAYLVVFIIYFILASWFVFIEIENQSLKIGFIGVGVGLFSIGVVYLLEFLRVPEKLIIKRTEEKVDKILNIVKKRKVNE